MNTMRREATTIALSLLLAAAGALAAEDWPRYRGANGDGRSGETILKTWPAGGPKQLWKVALGTGYSGIAAVGERAYVLFGNGQDEFLLALEAATGKEVFRVRLDRDRPDDMGSGPRATPTVDGGLVYALGASGKLAAVDAKTGVEKWRQDLVAAYGAGVPQWGISTSPLIEGDLLLLDVGGRRGFSLVALDKATGALRWSSETDGAGYSVPLAVTVDGLRQVLFFTATSLVSISPKDGRAYWRIPWQTSYDVNAAMPVFLAPDSVFISTNYGKGAQVLRIKKQGEGAAVDQVWKSTVMKNHFNSSVLVDGHLYGFDDSTLKCIEAATGTEKWKARGYGKGSLLYADGHLLVLSDAGTLALVTASPAGHQAKATAEVITGKTWTMPTLAGGRLFIRSEKELIALDLKG